MIGAAQARSPSGADRSVPAWALGYEPRPGRPDELLDADGVPREGWRRFLTGLGSLAPDEIARRFASAERHIRDTGVSYRVYGDTTERTWPVGSLPLLIDAEEWREIEAGIVQRATLLEAVLRDVYGPGDLIGPDLPAAAVAGSPEFLRAVHGMEPPGGRYLHLYAADLTRGPDGRWHVLSDRTQAPSGAGYALENRLVMSRAFPDLFGALHVARLAPFFQGLREGLAATADRSDPRICLLTSGPSSETYFEQAYLARYLGFLLVEGDDLTTRDGRVHVRTVAGLKRADVLWRRVDGDFVDPLELNPASRLGVPGLVEALRAGTVAVANMPGSGLAEAAALATFLPRLSRRLLGEDLKLAGPAGWWCGDEAGRDRARARFDEVAIAPAFAPPGATSAERRLGADIDVDERERLLASLHDRPGDYVAFEPVRYSTAPVWSSGRLAARPFALRVFAAATPQGWRVMPGGFCRIALRDDTHPAAMGAGVQAADVWVLGDNPAGSDTLLPRRDQVRVRRVTGHLPSRAADNLFWFGRYVERAEAVIRLVRCVLNGRDNPTLAEGTATERIGELLVRWSAASAPEPPALDVPVLAMARQALCGVKERGSAAAHVRSARFAASGLRERLSGEAWRALTDLGRVLDAGQTAVLSGAELVGCTDRALQAIAALSGLAGENMNRAGGWHFVDMGRRIERAVNTCVIARLFAGADARADDLGVLLDLVDSQITYGARYILGVSLAPVRDMALLDGYNPRSVAFQLDRLVEHLATLPSLRADGVPERQARLAGQLASDLAVLEAADLDAPAVEALEGRIMALADAISSRFFPGGPTAMRPETLTGLA